MRLSILALFVLRTVLAAPTNDKRQDARAVTDKLLFNTTLPVFVANRTALNPSYLDWTSDGCTDSPDNPLGFPYLPACYRHDFGYNNYRDQSRFTVSGKAAIDSNFKKDLYGQCDRYGKHVTICKTLADLYYQAVKEYGGKDASPGKRSIAYEEKLAIYNQLVAEAMAKGELVLVDTE